MSYARYDKDQDPEAKGSRPWVAEVCPAYTDEPIQWIVDAIGENGSTLTVAFNPFGKGHHPYTHDFNIGRCNAGAKLAVWPVASGLPSGVQLILMCLEVTPSKKEDSHGWPLEGEMTLTLKGRYADDFVMSSGKLGSAAAPIMRSLPELNEKRQVYGPWAVPVTLCYLFGRKHDKVHVTIDIELEKKGEDDKESTGSTEGTESTAGARKEKGGKGDKAVAGST